MSERHEKTSARLLDASRALHEILDSSDMVDCLDPDDRQSLTRSETDVDVALSNVTAAFQEPERGQSGPRSHPSVSDVVLAVAKAIDAATRCLRGGPVDRQPAAGALLGALEDARDEFEHGVRAGAPLSPDAELAKGVLERIMADEKRGGQAALAAHALYDENVGGSSAGGTLADDHGMARDRAEKAVQEAYAAITGNDTPDAMARERVESGISRTLEAVSERMAELQSRLDDLPAAERETRAGYALIAEIGATDRLAAGIEGAGERYASECELADGYATRGPAGGRDDPQIEIKTGAGRPKGGPAR